MNRAADLLEGEGRRKTDLSIGEVFRYSRPYSHIAERVEGRRNFFNVTHTEGAKLVLLESGINGIAVIKARDGVRRPAVLIRSSPHKIGSAQTPWNDSFDVDNGRVLYYGDNKDPGRDPGTAPGNRLLLECFRLHTSTARDLRMSAPPVVLFRAVAEAGRVKGYVEFQGFGIIRGVELITQFDQALGRSFSNYAYEIVTFSQARERESFDWTWISQRRNPALTAEETLRSAPWAWRQWIERGSPSVEEVCQRRVSKLLITPVAAQKAPAGSKQAEALRQVYEFYSGLRKARFEALAARVTQRVVEKEGATYRFGWITPPSSDHGVDYVGRLDVGTGFSSAKMIVLGQAKCERLDASTGGNHIARTVARLKRGWLGAYVTTSHFSESVQREVIEDEYPILLVHGLRVAEEVVGAAVESGIPVDAYLRSVDQGYERLVRNRAPEEILRVSGQSLDVPVKGSFPGRLPRRDSDLER